MRRIDLLDHLIISGGFSVPDLQSRLLQHVQWKVDVDENNAKEIF